MFRTSRQRCARALPLSRAVKLLPVGLLPLLLTSCESIGPKPWEHDLLAKREMQVDPYPLQSNALEHIYFSKEASSGGRGFAGGGCGCN